MTGRHSLSGSRRSARTSPRLRRVAQTGAWAIGDQAVSSMSNLFLAVLVGRASTPREFGAYSLAFSAYALSIGLSRAVGGSTFMIRYAARPRREQRQHYRELTGVGVCVALVGSGALVVAAAVAGGATTRFFVVVAVLLPGLVLQDDWRQAMFAARDARAAFFCDLAWLLIEVPLLGVAFEIDRTRPELYVAAWGIGALAAGTLFATVHKVAPSLAGAYRFVRSNFNLVPGLTGEYLAVTGGGQLLPYGVAGVLGLGAAGALRAGQVVLGLASTALMGLTPIAMAYCVRAYQSGGLRRLHRVQIGLVIPGCVWMAVFGVGIHFMPASVGRALTGHSWDEARHLLAALTVVYVAQWASTINLTAVRAAGMVRQAAMTRTVVTVVLLAATLGLGSAYGLDAAIWGMAGGATLGALISAFSTRGPGPASPGPQWTDDARVAVDGASPQT